jgi:S-adenosylmethionine hydrolase
MPALRPTFALLTDFGTRDPFVGVMKGVVLSRCPDAAIIDLSHDVPPQNVGEGAFWLERSFRFLPEGAVVVAVVDPGVGTARRALAARAHGRLFVGPDNGLLAPVLASDGRAETRAVSLERLGLPPPSRTFHGRDVFAPVAAELAVGRLALSDVGPEVADVVPCPRLPPARKPGRVEGTVVTVDRFGNLITDIDRTLISDLGEVVVEVGSLGLELAETYADAGRGDYVAIVNAFDTVEIARRDGNAEAALGLGRGSRVVVRRRPR